MSSKSFDNCNFVYFILIVYLPFLIFSFLFVILCRFLVWLLLFIFNEIWINTWALYRLGNWFICTNLGCTNKVSNHAHTVRDGMLFGLLYVHIYNYARVCGDNVVFVISSSFEPRLIIFNTWLGFPRDIFLLVFLVSSKSIIL